MTNFPVDQRQQRIVSVAGGDRHIVAETERVELIDPGVVARLGAARSGHALELRARIRIERPAFGAMLAGRRRPVERPLAFSPVEAGEMTACQRSPDDAIAVDIHAARRIPVGRRFIDLGQCGRRRVWSRSNPHDRPGIAQHRAPDRPIERAGGDTVQAGHDALVLVRIDRLVGLDIIVALAVAVGVENEGGPALRLLRVAGGVEHFGIEPADDIAGAAAAEPQRVVGIAGELQMMGRETQVDQRELAGFSDRTSLPVARIFAAGTTSRRAGPIRPCKTPGRPPDGSWR